MCLDPLLHGALFMNEVHYMVRVEDIASLNHHHIRTSKLTRKSRQKFMALIFGTMFLLAGLGTLAGSPALGIVILLLLTGVFSGAATLRRSKPSGALVRRMKHLFSEGRNVTIFGQHNMKLLEDHVEIQTEHSVSQIKWTGIEKIEQSDDYIYIYVSSLTAHIIHKRFFASREHAQAFYELASRLQQQGLMRLEGWQPAGLLAHEPIPAQHNPMQHNPMQHNPMQPPPTHAPTAIRLPSSDVKGLDGSV